MIVATEDGEKEAEMLAKFRDFQSKSEMYYVYHAIQRYTVNIRIARLNVYWYLKQNTRFHSMLAVAELRSCGSLAAAA